jgi:hypothetical protein
VAILKITCRRREISNVPAAAVIWLLAFFASGCSKTEISPAANARDLGTIELRSGQAKSLDLGGRKECWFLASPATNDEFLLDVTINVRSYVGIVDNEQTRSAHVAAHSGSNCVVMLGTNAFQFTPVLAAP